MLGTRVANTYRQLNCKFQSIDLSMHARSCASVCVSLDVGIFVLFDCINANEFSIKCEIIGKNGTSLTSKRKERTFYWHIYLHWMRTIFFSRVLKCHALKAHLFDTASIENENQIAAGFNNESQLNAFRQTFFAASLFLFALKLSKQVDQHSRDWFQ